MSEGETTSRPEGLYRGVDRRRVTASDETIFDTGYFVAAGLLAVIWLGVTVVTALAPPGGESAQSSLQGLLEVAGATLGCVVGMLSLVRWRLSGENPSLWLGVALLVFGLVTIATATLFPIVDPNIRNGGFDGLRAASRAVVIVLIFIAVRSPVVDSSAGLGRVIGFAALGITGITALLALAPQLGVVVAGAAESKLVPPGRPTSLIVTPAWLCLTVLSTVSALRWRRGLFAWFGLFTAGLALAEITRLVALVQGVQGSASAELVRVVALACALTGATLELQRSFAEQRGTAFESHLHALTAEARIRAERALLEERAHDARNALAAIDGATRTLEFYRDKLPPETREQLTRAVSGEIMRLQRLISAQQLSEEARDFSVAEALAPVITGARTQGLALQIDIPPGLSAHGRWADTAEVVQNLLQNAHRYAGDHPVTLHARAVNGQVEIRVEDRGPGIPDAERERIFTRGGRGSATQHLPGSGLGLYVSAQLMGEQGGGLHVEDRPGGGAVFVARLPASGVQATAEPVDDGEQGGEVADGN